MRPAATGSTSVEEGEEELLLPDRVPVLDRLLDVLLDVEAVADLLRVGASTPLTLALALGGTGVTVPVWDLDLVNAVLTVAEIEADVGETPGSDDSEAEEEMLPVPVPVPVPVLVPVPVPVPVLVLVLLLVPLALALTLALLLGLGLALEELLVLAVLLALMLALALAKAVKLTLPLLLPLALPVPVTVAVTVGTAIPLAVGVKAVAVTEPEARVLAEGCVLPVPELDLDSSPVTLAPGLAPVAVPVTDDVTDSVPVPEPELEPEPETELDLRLDKVEELLDDRDHVAVADNDPTPPLT